MRNRSVLLLVSLLLLSISIAAQDAAHAKKAAAPEGAAKFMEFPGLPGCLVGSVQNGDPMKGAAVILAKAKTGCVVPWHWHTATEQLMFVSGTASVEMKDAGKKALSAGGYVNLPGKHQHEFRCTASCTFFITTDAAFDIHYVDASGNEIPVEQALKPAAKAKGMAAPAKKK